MDDMKRAALDLAAMIRKKTNNLRDLADFALASSANEDLTPTERSEAKKILKNLAARGIFPTDPNE